MSAGSERPRLLFLSARFLFPVDSGGKIRTTQVLRGMRGGAFDITLAAPAAPGAAQAHAEELATVCDRFVGWPAPARGPLFPLLRLRHLASSLPVAVATDRSAAGRRAVAAALADGPCDLLVVDFPHAHVLAPDGTDVPRVMFTHNVEAEIFRRHVDVAANPLARRVWQHQLQRMERYERDVLADYDRVVAVSPRDATAMRERYGLDRVVTIDTGVDLDFFSYAGPEAPPTVVFTGSMDWMANADGIEFFLERVWPLIVARVPAATMRVVGRSPPPALVERARRLYPESWTFTGFVDDVRPAVHGARAFVIPLRVGGGTRLKAYEAMAMGCPIVSTAIGMEGLAATPGEHYLLADDPAAFADAVVALLEDHPRAVALAQAARHHVDEHASFRRIARDFERICLDAMADARTRPRASGARRAG